MSLFEAPLFKLILKFALKFLLPLLLLLLLLRLPLLKADGEKRARSGCSSFQSMQELSSALTAQPRSKSRESSRLSVVDMVEDMVMREDRDGVDMMMRECLVGRRERERERRTGELEFSERGGRRD